MSETEYCLRIDVVGDETEFRERVVTWLAKQGRSIGCYECPGDANPHYHVWLFSKKTCATIRANFKRYFPECKGNGSYSIKEDTGNLQYIAKGDEESKGAVIIVNTMGITEDELAQAHAARWMKTRALEAKKQKGVTFLDVVEDRFDEWLEKRDEEAKRRGFEKMGEPSRKEISRWLIDTFQCMRKLWDVGIVTKYTNYLEYKVNPCIRDMVANIVYDKY